MVDRDLLRFFVTRSVVSCTEFLVASISTFIRVAVLGHVRHHKLVCCRLIFFSVLRTDKRERVYSDLKANGYPGYLSRKCRSNRTKPRPSQVGPLRGLPSFLT